MLEASTWPLGNRHERVDTRGTSGITAAELAMVQNVELRMMPDRVELLQRPGARTRRSCVRVSPRYGEDPRQRCQSHEW